MILKYMIFYYEIRFPSFKQCSMNSQAKLTSYFRIKKSSAPIRSKYESNEETINDTRIEKFDSDDDLIKLSDIVIETFDALSSEPEELITIETPLHPEYSVSNLTPRIEQESVENSYVPRTPVKKSKRSRNDILHSPKSGNYNQNYAVYTPSTRKYIKRIKRINRAKMNLNKKLSEETNIVNKHSDDFHRASRQQDDSTIFLLEIIQSYTMEKSLHHLLDDKQHDLIVQFLKLHNPQTIKVMSKMYWLQWKWQRSDVLVKRYSCHGVENSHEEGFHLLCSQGYIDPGTKSMTLDNWLSVMTKPELVTVCKEFKIDCKNADKAKLSNGLHAYCSKNSKTLLHFFSQSKDQGTDDENNPIKQRVIRKIISITGECYKISTTAKRAFDRLHLLMYLGLSFQIIRDKKLNLLLLNVKNGKECFPSPQIDTANQHNVIFPTKEHFVMFEEAHILNEDVIQLTEMKVVDHMKVINLTRQAFNKLKGLLSNKHSITWNLPAWLLRFTPHYKYTKIIEIGVLSLKSQKNSESYEEAVNMLDYLISQSFVRQHKRWHWYNEKALILQMRLNRHLEASKVLIAALKEVNIPDVAKEPLRDRANRLASLKNSNLEHSIVRELLLLSCADKLEIPRKEIYSQAIEGNTSGKKARYVTWLEDGNNLEKTFMSVEDYALTYYIKEGHFTSGSHVEGRLVSNIFLLLFWDIIYTQPKDVPGIFLSKYQFAPLDMYTDDFYENRKKSIDERLNYLVSLEIDNIKYIAEETYKSRPDGEVSLLNSTISLEDISNVLSCLTPNQLVALCKRFAMSYYYSGAGFPDLTLWNNNTKKVIFVEVKGDGDRLSTKQIQWIAYLLEHGLDAEVCYVGKKHRKTGASKSPAKSKGLT